MQLLPSASPLGAPAASDATASDTRSVADPANAGAFQAALSAARQGPGARTAERTPGRPTAPSSQDDDATAADGEPLADATVSSDEMAALLLWLVPMSAAPTPTAPTPVPTTGDAPAGEATAPLAALATAPSAPAASEVGQAGSQVSLPLGTAAQNGSATPTASRPAPLTIDDLLAPGASTTSQAGQPAPLTAFAASQAEVTLAGAVPPSSGGIPLPADLLTSTASTDSALPVDFQITSAAATSTTQAPQIVADGSAPGQAPTIATAQTPDRQTGAATPVGSVGEAPVTPLAATIVANDDTGTIRGDPAATTATTTDGTAATASTSTPTASPATAPAASWASLAADFGARIVATTAPTTTRSAGQTAPRAGHPAVAADAQLPADGSTAQAAGAATTAGIQLPGQAVAAAGTTSDATTGTFAEALAAGPTAPATTTARRTQAGAPTELHAAAIGAVSPGTIGQTQAAGPVQASAPAAPPIASQIADLAQVASRRLGQSVQMVLQPEGLGTVTLRVSVERAGLGVHIAVDNAQTRELVQASWPQLQQALDQRGLTVQSMLLDLSQGRSNGEAFQAFQQFAGQQRAPGQQARGGSSAADRRGAVASVDDAARPQPGGGSSSRVDYRI